MTKILLNFRQIKDDIDQEIFNNHHHILKLTIQAILLNFDNKDRGEFFKDCADIYKYREEDVILKKTTEADEYLYNMLDDMDKSADLYIPTEAGIALNPYLMMKLTEPRNFMIALALQDLDLSLVDDCIEEYNTEELDTQIDSIEEFAHRLREYLYGIKMTSKILKVDEQLFCFYELEF